MQDNKIPIQLQQEEYRFIKVAKQSKRPIENEWQKTANYEWNSQELQDHLKQGGNYGVLGGFGGLVIIDCDQQQVWEEVEKHLPETLTINTGSDKKHFYYKCDRFDAPIRLMDTKAGDLGDVQSKGKQVVGAGSIHPNGNTYSILKDIPIAKTTQEEIKLALRQFVIQKKEPLIVEEKQSLEIPITNIANTTSMKKHGNEYFGEHPAHGSDGGQNFWINPQKNTWHCFRHDTGGGSLSLIAVQEGIIDCSEAVSGGLKGNKFIETLDIARKKYGLKEETKEETTKPGVRLPCPGNLISEFAEEIAEIIKGKNILFYRIDQREIIEIGKIKNKKTDKFEYTGFIPITPNRFITLTEEHLTPGKKKYDEESGEYIIVKKSMKRETANTVIASKIMQEALPQIERIFTIPIPIILNDTITFPEKGFDKRFCSWLPHDAPEITNPEMELKEAKEIMKEIFSEFCFQTKQDYHNAISALLTPFLRGLFPKFCTRTPIFFYLGNRPRTGKDYCAGINGIVYQGYPMEEPAVSTEENKRGNSSEEMRKKILSGLMSGKKRMHFSNNKGFINNTSFEQIATTEHFSDRVLGKNELLSFENEIDFSLSGNAGVSFTPDFAARCRFIRLFFDKEDANKRDFDRPKLHEWVLKNRERILSALYALVRNWFDKGQPKGSEPFASFSSWADTCGGIMEAAGYKNPCNVDKETLSLGGDNETSDMKELFEEFFEEYPEQWKTKKHITEFIRENTALFEYLNLEEKSGEIKLGLLIKRFTGRVFSDIRLISDNQSRASRQNYKFTKIPIEIDEDIFGEKEVKQQKKTGEAE